MLISSILFLSLLTINKLNPDASAKLLSIIEMSIDNDDINRYIVSLKNNISTLNTKIYNIFANTNDSQVQPETDNRPTDNIIDEELLKTIKDDDERYKDYEKKYEVPMI